MQIGAGFAHNLVELVGVVVQRVAHLRLDALGLTLFLNGIKQDQAEYASAESHANQPRKQAQGGLLVAVAGKIFRKGHGGQD